MPIRWQCPSAMATRVYSTKSDVYSYGVLLYEIFSGGGVPFGTLTTTEVIPAVRAGQRLPRPRVDTPEGIIALIRECTLLDVAQRPSMRAVYTRTSAEGLAFHAPGPAAANGLLADVDVDEAGTLSSETSL